LIKTKLINQELQLKEKQLNSQQAFKNNYLSKNIEFKKTNNREQDNVKNKTLLNRNITIHVKSQENQSKEV